MKKLNLLGLLLLLSFAIEAQEDITNGVKAFLKDYEAMLNNLSDPSLSLNERKLFREDILDIYFVRNETTVINHLNNKGSQTLKGREYLENLLLDYNNRVKHELIIGVDMEFDIPNSTFNVPVRHILNIGSEQYSDQLLYVIKWYNDSRPDILSVISGAEVWEENQDKIAFEEAQEEHSIAAYNNYMDEYPNGNFEAQAKAAIATIQDEEFWRTTVQNNTINSYEEYITSYPEGRHIEKAQEVLQELNEKAKFEQLPSPIQLLVKNFKPIAGGTFQMGCAESNEMCFEDEQDLRMVTVDDFQIGTHEVTQEQWEAIMGDNPASFKDCPQCPVESVSWYDVQEFINKLNDLTGEQYRLPTEGEWEYAASGSSRNREQLYAGGNNIAQLALYSKNSDYELTPASKQPNSRGLYNMSGSVYEWCATNYISESVQGEDECKVIKGGAWNSSSRYCRVAHRFWLAAGDKMNNIGFRLVKDE